MNISCVSVFKENQRAIENKNKILDDYAHGL